MTVFVLLTSRCQRSSLSAAALAILCSAASHSMPLPAMVISAVSSANWLHEVVAFSQAVGRSIVYARNRSGPRIEPWCTHAGME